MILKQSLKPRSCRNSDLNIFSPQIGLDCKRLLVVHSGTTCKLQKLCCIPFTTDFLLHLVNIYTGPKLIYKVNLPSQFFSCLDIPNSSRFSYSPHRKPITETSELNRGFGDSLRPLQAACLSPELETSCCELTDSTLFIKQVKDLPVRCSFMFLTKG